MKEGARDSFVSVVAVIRDSEPYLQAYVSETLAVLAASFRDYELILVDDGSSDGTAAAARRVVQDGECVRLLVLSREFGDDIAITAGLDSAIGDTVVTMLARTDPPAMIPDLVDRLRVDGRTLIGTTLGPSGSGLRFRIQELILGIAKKFLSTTVPKNVTQYRALTRQAVGALLESRDRQRSLAVLTTHIGHGSALFSYQPLSRDGVTRTLGLSASLAELINLSIAGGRRPLRAVSLIGLIGSLANIVYAGYVVLIFLLRQGVVEGWTTTSLEMSLMFFLLFALLSAMAEYLGVLLTESRDRPLYYVLDEYSSPAPFREPNRENVLQIADLAGTAPRDRK